MFKDGICVYQVYYNYQQQELMDPAFTPYENIKNPNPDLREFYLLKQMYEQQVPKQHILCGLVSPKFTEKAMIAGSEFIDWVHNNMGHEAYFINPFPHECYIHFDLWACAEFYHPGLCALTQKCFDDLGYDISLKDFPRTPASQVALCNFWVATEHFWNDFMEFALPIYDYMLQNSGAGYLDYPTPTYNGTYFAYIMERLFTTFIIYNNRDAICYPILPGAIEKYAKNEAQLRAAAYLKDVTEKLDETTMDNVDRALYRRALSSFSHLLLKDQ